MKKIYRIIHTNKVAVFCVIIGLVLILIYFEFFSKTKPLYYSVIRLFVMPLLTVLMLLYDQNKKDLT